jgi:hypothetical protein
MPIRTVYGPTVRDAALSADVPLPSYLENYTRTR